jgi:hypothetical protein
MKRYSLICAKKLVSLVCSLALLLPTLPAVAADAALFRDDFEGYGDNAALNAVWVQAGGTAKLPQLSRVQAASGSYSMLMEDVETDQAFQARATFTTATPRAPR